MLLTATALALLVYPILTHAYDARFTVPALGPLVGGAALGAWGLWPVLARGARGLRRRWEAV